MATVAEQLRRAREEQELTIYQVAEITKIKTEHIRALEAGDFDVFSAPVYIRGFVRTYAKFLKLDSGQVSADLDAELSQNKKFRQPPPLTNQPSTPIDFLMLQVAKLNRRWAATLLGIAVLVTVGVVLFRSFSSRTPSDPTKKLSPGLYQSTQDVSGEVLPLPSPPPRR